MAVKTDISKAYDRIEWNFLEAVLVKLDFHPKWNLWIMECIRSVSYSFLVNGAAQGKVVPSRGIRQGDPLSPYLFILRTEVLSSLCSKSLQDGKMAGIKVARGCPPINHPLFADDTMFFTKTNVASCEALKRILLLYESASGQCINLGMSAITFSEKTPREVKTRVKEFFNIQMKVAWENILVYRSTLEGKNETSLLASFIGSAKDQSAGPRDTCPAPENKSFSKQSLQPYHLTPCHDLNCPFLYANKSKASWLISGGMQNRRSANYVGCLGRSSLDQRRLEGWDLEK